MVYTYTPTYYTSLHDSITSICKTILPFPFKKHRRMPAIAAAEHRLSKQQSDNLKWQQESFHQILNLIGLSNEGIIPNDDVSSFRTHLLETILTPPPVDHEPPPVLRDKLIFLQELFLAKCISEDEYHSSKRPLLQRLAVQGAVIGTKDVIIGTQICDKDWSFIDLKEDRMVPIKLESKKSNGVGIPKDRIGVSVLSSTENPFWVDSSTEKEIESKSILMTESSPPESIENGKKKINALFQKNRNDEKAKSMKKSGLWGFNRLVKWKKNDSEDETMLLSLTENSKKPCPNAKEELTVVEPKNNFRDDRIDDDNRKKLFTEPRRDLCKDNIGQHDSIEWTRFDDEDENAHPNVVHRHDRRQSSAKQPARLSINNSSIDKGFKYNPFFDM
ncbi:uncharacterized protein LOC127264924 isoform X2 [Andrographis paniculata]|uniref:uncharacterized protein LOC127264924 isoform X2 n=1 Tax=Andrographis paniculata TaxID=175694 RepID=UPI0021E93C69|nr:uncharacterized protein LOC127264924 isoform X2 [Andrographis paniculata]